MLKLHVYVNETWNFHIIKYKLYKYRLCCVNLDFIPFLEFELNTKNNVLQFLEPIPKQLIFQLSKLRSAISNVHRNVHSNVRFLRKQNVSRDREIENIGVIRPMFNLWYHMATEYSLEAVLYYHWSCLNGPWHCRAWAALNQIDWPRIVRMALGPLITTQ